MKNVASLSKACTKVLAASAICLSILSPLRSSASQQQEKIAPSKFYSEGNKAFKAKQYDLAKNYWLQATGNGGLSKRKYKIVITNLLSVRDYTSASLAAKCNIKDYNDNEQGYAYNALASKLLDADTTKGTAIDPIELYNTFLASKKVTESKKKIILSNYNYLLYFYTKQKNYKKSIETSSKMQALFPNVSDLALLPKEYAVSSSYKGTGGNIDTAAVEASLKANAAQKALDANFKGNAALEAKNFQEAKDHFEEAERLGNRNASLQLGKMYEKGLGVPQDYVKAKEQYQTALGKEAPGSYAAMGNLYENGLGVPKDLFLAKEWYSKGRDLGDSASMEKIARFSTGKNGALTVAKTVANTEGGEAGTGTETAATVLKPGGGKSSGPVPSTGGTSAELLNKGYEESKAGNYDQARQYWEKAAEAKAITANKFKAMYELGNLYFNGNGVEKDYKKAFDWYLKGSANGYPGGSSDACKSVGTMYENGFGTTQNFALSLSWYKKAEKLGNQFVAEDIQRVSGNVKKGGKFK